MENKKKNPVASIILTLICILWMYPIVLILVNSLKKVRLQLQVYSVFLQLRHGMVLQTLWQVLHRWISSNPSGTVL